MKFLIVGLLFLCGCAQVGDIRGYADKQYRLTVYQKEAIAQRIPYVGMDSYHLNAMFGRYKLISSQYSEYGKDIWVEYYFYNLWVHLRNDKVVSWGQ